jgi:uncharacterized protein (TIGR02391 family)
MTKWRRIDQALMASQTEDGNSARLIRFIEHVMAPARHRQRPSWFENARSALNGALIFCGLALTEEGRVCQVSPATTLRDAQGRVRGLRSELERRNVHSEVLRFCGDELLADDSFHAVHEAIKGVAARVRGLTGLTTDGAALFRDALSPNGAPPKLYINKFSTTSERNEQEGFAKLLTGLVSMIRNPTAHSPRVDWPIDDADALDVLSIISLAHRRLDRAVALKNLDSPVTPE